MMIGIYHDILHGHYYFSHTNKVSRVRQNRPQSVREGGTQYREQPTQRQDPVCGECTSILYPGIK